MSADPQIQDPYNLQNYDRYGYCYNNPVICTDPSGYSFWTKFRGIFVRAVAAVADGLGCAGFCSAAVGAYQGYQSGGVFGAIVGGVGGYAGFQLGDSYQMVTGGGVINWENVGINAAVNAATGCAGAVAGGGDCGRGAVVGAVGTLGSVYGALGSIIAGCAAGKIGGGSCGDGALNAFGNYVVHSAIGYIADAVKQNAAEPPPKLACANCDISLASTGDVAGGTGQGSGLGGLTRGLGRFLFGVLGMAIGIDQIVQSNAYINHYTTEAGRDGIISSGFIQRSKDNFVYVTPDYYTSGIGAQQRLSLSVTPQGYLMVPFGNIQGALPPRMVAPGNGQPGGGQEVRVPYDVSSKGVRWIPIRP